MADEGQITSAEVGGFTVETNTGATPEEISENLTPEGAKPEPPKEEKSDDEKRSEAAAELGKAGGKATAEKRAAEAKDGAKSGESEPAAKDGKEEAKAGEAEAEKSEAPEKKEPEGEEEKEKPLGPPSKDPNARVRQAVAEKNEAKRERDDAYARAEALEARIAALERGEKPKAEQPPERLGKPKAEDYPDDPEGYLDARDAWNLQQLEERQRGRSQVEEIDRALDAQVSKFRDSVHKSGIEISEDGIGSFLPEFMLKPGERPNAENWIANELVFSPENAPSLMLYLEEHPDALQRIAALSNPRAVSREMAKLEARLESAAAGTRAKPDKEEVSKAAPPVTPVTGTSYVAEGGEPDISKGFDSYHKARQKQIHTQR